METLRLARRNFLRGDFGGRGARPLKASIGASCLAVRGVVCRSCGDACEARAIRFRPIVRGVAQPFIEAEACNGCGDCRNACPVGAIAMLSVHNAPAESTSVG